MTVAARLQSLFCGIKPKKMTIPALEVKKSLDFLADQS
jgi:hypothetical protein